MNVHEYQAKALLRDHGVAVPPGELATTPAEAEEVARRLGAPVLVVKAQVHAGGRGKAGGIKLARSAGEAKTAASEMLGMTLRSDGGANSCFLNCGPDFLALFRAEKPAMHHYCYSIEKYDPDESTQKLEAAGLNPRRQGDRVYFDDPDGLVVQVAAGE